MKDNICSYYMAEYFIHRKVFTQPTLDLRSHTFQNPVMRSSQIYLTAYLELTMIHAPREVLSS